MYRGGGLENTVGWQDPVFFIRIKKKSHELVKHLCFSTRNEHSQRCREVLSLHTDGLGSPKSCLMGVGATGAWLLVHASCGEPTLSVPTSPPVVVTTTRSR